MEADKVKVAEVDEKSEDYDADMPKTKEEALAQMIKINEIVQEVSTPAQSTC